MYKDWLVSDIHRLQYQTRQENETIVERFA